MHDRAWAVVQPHFKQAQDKTAALYRQLAGTGRTSKDAAEIVSAAHQGQIQFLFVALGQPTWGAFDPDDLKVDVHKTEKPGDEDLSNVAAVHVLSHGGTVYAVEPEDVPERAPLAAIFRLPVGERKSKRIL